MTVRLGIGIDREGALLGLPDHLPPEFRELEFSGEMLDSSPARRRVHRFAPDRLALSVHDLVPPELARLVPTQKLALQLEFTKLFRARCRRAAELKAQEIGVSFDLETAFGDARYAAELMRLLRACWGILAEFRLTLRFSLRLPPEPGKPELSRFVEFRRSCLCPAVAFALELHPLEPGMARLNKEALKPLRFCNELWRLEFSMAERRQVDFEAVNRVLKESGELLPGPRRVILAPAWLNGEERQLKSLVNMAAPLLGKQEAAIPDEEEGGLLLC